MSTRHDPAAVGTDPAAAGDAWLDVAPAGASAWDDQSDGDASAWAGSAEPAGSVWDDDAPPPASAWDEDEHVSVRDDGTDAPAPARGRRAAGTAPERAGRAASTAPAGAGAAEQSPEVAAVAARLAEIVARSGAGRVDTAATTAATHPAAAAAAARAAAAAAEAPAPGVPETVADPDAEPVARRGATGGGPRDAGRRRTSGRRRAPATEPPGSGAAASDAEPDPESVARAIALRQLTAAPRSRAQLAEAMARRDVPEDVADRVLDRFTEVGLVDDAAYAEILVRSRHAERGMSRRALAMELRRKGVDDEVAREALEQVDDVDEEHAARALARKKLRATRGLDREVRLRRAYGALGRRGYGGSLVSRVVREELAAESEDVGDG